MSNKPRICEPEKTYHTRSRCIDRSMMMKHRKMKDLMLKVMNMAMEKYHFELINYVIMDNHFHFYIRTVIGGESISRIMQFIKSQYARRYNRMNGRIGPFWNERFSDTIIEYSEDPEEVFNYINQYIMYNPVRAGYVSDPRDYRYGCIHFYLDESYVPPVKLTHHKYFLKLGKTFKERSRKFRAYEEKFRNLNMYN